MQNAGPRDRRPSAAIGWAPDGAYKTPAQPDRAPNGPWPGPPCSTPRPAAGPRDGMFSKRLCACPSTGAGTEWLDSAPGWPTGRWMDGTGRGMPNTARGDSTPPPAQGNPTAKSWADPGTPRSPSASPPKSPADGADPARPCAAQPAFTTPFGRSSPTSCPSPQTPLHGGCRGGAKARATSGWRTSNGTPGTAAASKAQRPLPKSALDWAGHLAVRLATPGMRKATTSASASSGARTASSGFP